MIRVDALQDANFNWQAALTLATCSSLVYQRPRSVVTIMTDTYNFDACEFIDRRETQLFIASKNDRSIISFRGSASVTDWIRNLDVLQTDEPSYGNVHAGFYDGYQFVHQQILEVLNDLPDTQQIWVTGHSLGGALASLCVAELASSKHSQIMGCYTYGQPRTGNREFKRFIADQYGDRFFRFVNDDDIVPRIPPFYRHVGHLIHLGPDGSLLTEPPNDEFSGFESIMEADPLAENVDEESISELPSLTEAEFANLKESLASGEGLGFEATGDDSDGSAEGFFPSVSDHLMTEYIRKIRIHERAVSSMTESGSNGTVDIHVDLQASMMSDSSSESEGLGTLGGFESTNEPVLIPVLIRAFASWEAPSHIQINSKVDNIYTALVTADQIDE